MDTTPRPERDLDTRDLVARIVGEIEDVIRQVILRPYDPAPAPIPVRLPEPTRRQAAADPT